MKNIIIVILIITCFSGLTAQTENASTSPVEQQPNNRIGFSASMFSGIGLSYQHNFDPYAIKLVAFYYYYKNGTGNLQNEVIQGPNFNYDDKGEIGYFGAEFKYFVFKSKYMNLYPFFGLSYWLNSEDQPNIYTIWNPVSYGYTQYSYLHSKSNNTWNFGPGFGIELLAGKYVSFNFDIGFKYLNTQQTETQQNNAPDKLTEDIYFGIAVGGGISFVF